ncbi:unnamed protein product [Schistosoma mattheei]|uniref:Uncharacterized protein n=1 Tax=Schistosoma mattheei TaxID=31246 RepID=A0A183PGR7_9TREM|nr:unnamed protein product [Schistosoma mattheei]
MLISWSIQSSIAQCCQRHSISFYGVNLTIPFMCNSDS